MGLTAAPPAPARRLLGMELPGGWRVITMLPPPPKATGGFFSTGYLVKRDDGTEGFLKALDYSVAFSLPLNEIALELQKITESINFERLLLQTCGDKRLDRIVKVISSGQILPTGAPASDVVEYVIFELATADARHQMNSVVDIELSWIFRTLHHIATGLLQLHKNDIAHQDLKPSNVLVFEESEGRKLGDLGRAWRAGHNPPHNVFDTAGDRTYAPPELLYGFVPTDERARRFGCDVYHLGSMVVYFFMGVGTTALLISELDLQFRPGVWTGTYAQVLPFIQDAFGKVLLRLQNVIGAQYRSEVTEAVRTLCSPDPALRGHPRNRIGFSNQFSLERYVSQFDRLASQSLHQGRK